MPPVGFEPTISAGERPQAAHLLKSWVRIPPGAWIFVCCECRVLSGRGLCDELITRPEESYRLWSVVVCDLETSRIGAPYIYDVINLRVNPFFCYFNIPLLFKLCLCWWSKTLHSHFISTRLGILHVIEQVFLARHYIRPWRYSSINCTVNDQCLRLIITETFLSFYLLIDSSNCLETMPKKYQRHTFC